MTWHAKERLQEGKMRANPYFMCCILTNFSHNLQSLSSSADCSSFYPGGLFASIGQSNGLGFATISPNSGENDLLHKDRSSNNVKLRPDAPPGLAITSSMKNGVYMSTISTQLKERNITADINFKLGKHPNIFTNIVLDQRHLLPGLKAICNFNAFEPKSQMIEQLENKIWLVVDVRDVAESLLMVYEKPEAEGRYICTAYTINTQDLVKMLKRFYPEHEYPKSFTAATAGEKHSSEKLQTLGWSFRPLENFL
ncbi:hypothetical protein POM88_029282 [Heracleum sosnowskyi]|uniref:Uncharacterized protein n=1 Tax=Heracleum sosnowskyi TaxID=360622 RepID=A0AAD8HTC7_9APIA|nr:hypothetical protein POM88_029282 [Heracleum sosnowskyi]